MPRIIESLSTINSLIRTGLAVLAVGLIGAGGYYGYRTYNASDLAIQEKERRAGQTCATSWPSKQSLLEEQAASAGGQGRRRFRNWIPSLRLLKVNHRVAWLTVLEQEEDPETQAAVHDRAVRGGQRQGRDAGQAASVPHQGRRGLHRQLGGEVRRQVRGAGGDRTLHFAGAVSSHFWRVADAQRRDSRSTRSAAARTRMATASQMSDFEKQIWSEFWTIANDEAKAKELGIRAAHGEAPSMKLQKGKSYRIQLRASDGLSITPDSGPPPISANQRPDEPALQRYR